jgi:predicted metal-dependent hydrolase
MIQKYKELILKQEYYKAHESLETLWFRRRFEDNVEVTILKGFINAAVSFELKKRKKESQSKKVWKNYLKYRSKIFFSLEEEKRAKYYELSRFVEKHYYSLH